MPRPCLPSPASAAPGRRPGAPRRLFAVLALVLVPLLAPGPALAQVVTVDSALSAVGDGDRFPADAPALRVALPDDWSRTRPGSAGPVWYRVTLTVPQPPARGDLLALYVERACANVEVYLNDRLVHRGGRMTEPVTRNCQHPQLVELPSGLIAPGPNTLDLKVVGHPLEQVASAHRAGGLSALELGPQPLLAARHQRQLALNVALPQAVSATLALMGGFMFVLGWVDRRQSHLAYFGALSIGWAIAESRLWLRDLPFENAVAEFLLGALLPMLALAAVQFLLRHARLRWRWVDLALPLQCIAVPLSLVVAGPGRLHAAVGAWSVLLAAEVLAATAFYLRLQVRERRRASWPMAALIVVATVALAAEFVGQWLGVGEATTLAARIATPLAMVVAGLRLIHQHGEALRSAEDDKAELEARVRDATAEIERTFAQLAEARVEKVTERERKRIAADLHDDLGAKLLTIVHTSESERISSLAREALEEMRLSVRGLTGRPVQLVDAFGDWRAEVVSRLQQAGVEADWNAPAIETEQTLSARAFVQTTRILREAVSNVIKHSGASHCSVDCALAEGDLLLVVRDNGRGIPLELDGRLDRGHGMSSMKHRAKQLHGQCLVESGPGYGTVIRLTLPLAQSAEAA